MVRLYEELAARAGGNLELNASGHAASGRSPAELLIRRLDKELAASVAKLRKEKEMAPHRAPPLHRPVAQAAKSARASSPQPHDSPPRPARPPSARAIAPPHRVAPIPPSSSPQPSRPATPPPGSSSAPPTCREAHPAYGRMFAATEMSTGPVRRPASARKHAPVTHRRPWAKEAKRPMTARRAVECDFQNGWPMASHREARYREWAPCAPDDVRPWPPTGRLGPAYSSTYRPGELPNREQRDVIDGAIAERPDVILADLTVNEYGETMDADADSPMQLVWTTDALLAQEAALDAIDQRAAALPAQPPSTPSGHQKEDGWAPQRAQRPRWKMTKLQIDGADQFDARHLLSSGQGLKLLRHLARDGKDEDSGKMDAYNHKVTEVFRNRYVYKEVIKVEAPRAPKKVYEKKRKVEVKKQREWSLSPVSIWWPRKKWADSKDFFDDSEKHERAVFEHDWAIAERKYNLTVKLAKLVQKNLQPDQVQSIEAFKEAFYKGFDILYGMYDFYATQTTSRDVFSVKKQAYLQMVEELDIDNESVIGLRDADINLIWDATKVKMAKDDKYNEKFSCNREEWVSMLSQIIWAKYVVWQKNDVEVAVQRFIDEDLKPHLPALCFQDSNVFRQKFCYIEETDKVLWRYESTLRLMYEVFGAAGGAGASQKCIDLDEVCEMLERVPYVDESVTWREVKQAYSWTTLSVRDEQSDRGHLKKVSLSFEDFLELVVRLAYMMALPSDDELAALDAKHAGLFFERLEEEEGEDAIEEFQASHSLNLTDPLPEGQKIHQKVEQFMEWFIFNARGGIQNEGSDGKQRALKLAEMRALAASRAC